MQHHLLALIFFAGASVTLAAQTEPQNSSSPPKRDADKEMTMLGCVTRDATSNQQFTFTDSIDGTKYHVSGKSVNKFLGQPIQVVGIVDSRRIRIVGGLTPSPNIAGQAGAIDPGKAHVAAIDGATRGTGTGELPTFKVTRVSAVAGECRK